MKNASKTCPAAAIGLLLLLLLLLLGLPAAALAAWTSQPIPGSAGAVTQLGLVFDTRGQGLLTWEAFDQQASPQRVSAAAVRDPSGAWRAAPNLPGITWGGAAVHDYGATRALLVARQVSGTGAFNRARYRLVDAFGRSDGTFGAPRRLAENVAPAVASAVNAGGQALVAYADARTGAMWVAERSAGQAFGAPRKVGTGTPLAAAINARGDRVIAWWGRAGVYARVRLAGHSWGPAVLAARATPVANASLRAVVTPGGRAVVAWATADVREDAPLGLAAGVALREHGASAWHAFALERSSVPSGVLSDGDLAVPLVDSAGRTYVTWTGSSGGALAVKLAGVTAAGIRAPAVLSGGVPGAALEDAAAGPRGALAASFAVAGPSTTTVYASLRDPGGVIGAPARLTPVGALGVGGSRVAFDPLGGAAVVTWSAVGAGGRAALNAASTP
jgi:hypothetical protein